MTWLWPSFLYLLILIPAADRRLHFDIEAAAAFCRALFQSGVGARCASASILVAATFAVYFFSGRVDWLDHRIGAPGQHRQRTGWQSHDHPHD